MKTPPKSWRRTLSPGWEGQDQPQGQHQGSFFSWCLLQSMGTTSEWHLNNDDPEDEDQNNNKKILLLWEIRNYNKAASRKKPHTQIFLVTAATMMRGVEGPCTCMIETPPSTDTTKDIHHPLLHCCHTTAPRR